MSRIKIRTYKNSGNKDQEFFYDTLQEALEKYVELREQVPDFWNRPAFWPTIWINTEEGFQRVHSFAFKTLTPNTLETYKNERIIHTDDLLAQF